MRFQSVTWLTVVASSLLLMGCSGSAGTKSGNSTAELDPNWIKSLDEMIDYTANRRLSIKDHAAWQIIHGAFAYGQDFLIDVNGKDTPAIQYAINGGPMRGWNLYVTDKGVASKLEPGEQSGGMGHPDQWMGYLSRCGVKLTDPLVVSGKNYTFQAFINEAQAGLRDDMEATWTLMAFMVYLPLDATWKSRYENDSEWNLERLVRNECHSKNADIYASSCAGSHCMYSLASAVNRYQKEKNANELTGGWKLAEERVQQAIHDARENQNPDGTFSAGSFQRAPATPDVAQQIRATGHVLEFLCEALNDEEIREPWVGRAAYALTKLFQKTKTIDMECGALYHAAHSLVLFRERRFGPRPAQVAEQTK